MSNLIPYRFGRHPIARSEFPSLMDDFFRPFFGSNELVETSLRVDVKDEGDHYLLEADLPGLKKEDVHIDVEDGVLTISAQTQEQKEEKKADYVFNERRQMKYQRSFSLSGIDEAAISAKCEDGVLKLTMPKMVEEVKSGRRIEIE